MLGFIKKFFFYRISIFIDFSKRKFVDHSFAECSPIELSINNHECKVGPQNVNVNGDDPVFFPISIKKVNNPHAKLCVPRIVKNFNVKVSNLILRTNETRHIE